MLGRVGAVADHHVRRARQRVDRQAVELNGAERCLEAGDRGDRNAAHGDAVRRPDQDHAPDPARAAAQRSVSARRRRSGIDVPGVRSDEDLRVGPGAGPALSRYSRTLVRNASGEAG